MIAASIIGFEFCLNQCMMNFPRQYLVSHVEDVVCSVISLEGS